MCRKKDGRSRQPRGQSPSGGHDRTTVISPTRPASRGTRCATAVNGVKLLSQEYSRALWARCGVQGVTPC